MKPDHGYDNLLYLYQRQLADLRRLAPEFAKTRGKNTAGLQKNLENSADPHIERLIEALAFGHARIQQKLQDETAEFTARLNQTLSPLPQTIPCMSIVSFESPAAFEGQTLIPKGSTLKSSAYACWFKTCYDILLLPLAVANIQLISNLSKAPKISTRALSCLQITLRSQVPISKLELTSLRFFLNISYEDALVLYEQLFNHSLCLAVTDSESDPAPIFLNKDALGLVGFSEGEHLLPADQRTISGLTLLQDFYTLPEKFLFFDIHFASAGLNDKFAKSTQSHFDLYIFFDDEHVNLKKKITAQSLVLHATPVVNLFDLPGEPITLTPTQSAYPLIPDAASPPEHIEIYAIHRLIALSDTKATEYYPFFHTKGVNDGCYYHAHYQAIDGSHPDLGQDVYLSLSLPSTIFHFEPLLLYSELQCSNRNLPRQLPQKDKLQLSHSVPVTTRRLLAFTLSKYPHLGYGQDRRIALALDFGSLFDGTNAIHSLHNVLNLFNFTQSEEDRNALANLTSLTSREIITTTGQQVEITLTIENHEYHPGWLYLFGQVLQHFFNHCAPLNTRVRLRIEDHQGVCFVSEPRP